LPVRDDLAEELVDLLAGRFLHHPAPVGVEECLRIELVDVQDAVSKVNEPLELVLGQSHQAEEHGRGKDLGELLREVALTAVDEGVHEAVDASRDVLLLGLHATRCEERVQQLAVLGVQWRIDVERDQGPDVAQAHLHPGREELVVPQHVVGGLTVETETQAVAHLDVAAPVDHVQVPGLGLLEVQHGGGAPLGVVRGACDLRYVARRSPVGHAGPLSLLFETGV
jgi:hypothetical protein